MGVVDGYGILAGIYFQYVEGDESDDDD